MCTDIHSINGQTFQIVYVDECSRRVLCDMRYIAQQLPPFLEQCPLHITEYHKSSWSDC